jgi:hypothetical protein
MWRLLRKTNPFSRRRGDPISKHINGLGKNKYLIMGPDRARNQEQLCSQGSAIYWTGHAAQSTVVVRPLLSSKRRTHFETSKWSWKEQKYGRGSRRGPKPRMIVLAKAISKLLLCLFICDPTLP